MVALRHRPSRACSADLSSSHEPCSPDPSSDYFTVAKQASPKASPLANFLSRSGRSATSAKLSPLSRPVLWSRALLIRPVFWLFHRGEACFAQDEYSRHDSSRPSFLVTSPVLRQDQSSGHVTCSRVPLGQDRSSGQVSLSSCRSSPLPRLGRVYRSRCRRSPAAP